jgi:hypothetical protein
VANADEKAPAEHLVEAKPCFQAFVKKGFAQRGDEGASAYVTVDSGFTKDVTLAAFAATTNDPVFAEAVRTRPGAYQLLYRDKARRLVPLEGRTTLGDVGVGDFAELTIYLKLKGGAEGDALEESREEYRSRLIPMLRAIASQAELESQYAQSELEDMCKSLNVYSKDTSSAGLSRVLFTTFQPVRCVNLKRKCKGEENKNVNDAMACLAADPQDIEVSRRGSESNSHPCMRT